ncbi:MULTISPECIES: hypothetical protein [Novosphingobium]|uniref:Uncharacterized protein n=1 Tax=Novosphingobium mathurense TaxID=428990 RepID=A0A1U6HNR6_9SPHN
MLAGSNQGPIFSHPEYARDFREIYETSLAALPEEDPPADRLEIERLRRDANRAAAAGRTVSIKELT